ncbi:MAG TPA: hypothetical protein VF593_01405 [Chthoniobacteraceae bacterium]
MPPVHLDNWSPEADPTVSLHYFTHRIADHAFNPFQANARTIGS